MKPSTFKLFGVSMTIRHWWGWWLVIVLFPVVALLMLFWRVINGAEGE